MRAKRFIDSSIWLSDPLIWVAASTALPTVILALVLPAITTQHGLFTGSYVATAARYVSGWLACWLIPMAFLNSFNKKSWLRILALDIGLVVLLFSWPVLPNAYLAALSHSTRTEILCGTVFEALTGTSLIRGEATEEIRKMGHVKCLALSRGWIWASGEVFFAGLGLSAYLMRSKRGELAP